MRPDIEPVDVGGDAAERDVKGRLQQIAKLAPGWFDGTEKVPTEEELSELAVLMVQVVDAEGLPRPYLYPMPDGGVSAEWDLPDWAVTASFELAAHKVTLLATHLRSSATGDAEVDIRQAAAAPMVAKFVRQYLPINGG